MKPSKPALTLLGLSLLFATSGAFAQGPKTGVIDSARVYGDSALGKEILMKLQKIASGKEEEASRKEKELKEIQKKLEEQGKALSAEAQEKLQKEYQVKALEYQRFGEDAKREIGTAQQREQQEFVRKVIPVIEAFAKEQGYQLVLDKAATVFASETIDVTDGVITRLNSQIASAPAAKTDAKTDTKSAPKATAPAKK